ncbi:MFS transporter, partial [Frankia sp. CNm7]
FLAAALSGAPVPLVIAAAAATGATLPQVGPVARQRWAARLGDDPRLNTAYALESALDEVTFVVGPAAASLLAGFTPSAGTAASLVLAAVGVAAFAALPTPDAPPAPDTPPTLGSPLTPDAPPTPGSLSAPDSPPASDSLPAPARLASRPAAPAAARTPTATTPGRGRLGRDRSVLRIRGLVPLLVAAAALGAFFGTMDIGLVVYARAHSWAGASGLLPTLVTLSSLGVGIVYGTVHWRTSVVRRYAIAATLLAAGAALVPLAGWAGGIGAVVAAALITGLPLAPLIITGTALVGELVPAHRRTEGFTWIVIANSVGVAAGAPLTGALVDRLGATWALAALAVCGSLTAATALVAAVRLRAARATAQAPRGATRIPRARTPRARIRSADARTRPAISSSSRRGPRRRSPDAHEIRGQMGPESPDAAQIR